MSRLYVQTCSLQAWCKFGHVLEVLWPSLYFLSTQCIELNPVQVHRNHYVFRPLTEQFDTNMKQLMVMVMELVTKDKVGNAITKYTFQNIVIINNQLSLVQYYMQNQSMKWDSIKFSLSVPMQTKQYYMHDEND